MRTASPRRTGRTLEARTDGCWHPAEQSTLTCGWPRPALTGSCRARFWPRLVETPHCGISATSRGLEVTARGGQGRRGRAWASRSPGGLGGHGAQQGRTGREHGAESLGEEPEVGVRGQQGPRRTRAQRPAGAAVTEASLQGALPSPSRCLPRPASPHPPRPVGRWPTLLQAPPSLHQFPCRRAVRGCVSGAQSRARLAAAARDAVGRVGDPPLRVSHSHGHLRP